MSNIKTHDEIVALLEDKLTEAKAWYDKWENVCEIESLKHMVRIHTLEEILEEVDPVD